MTHAEPSKLDPDALKQAQAKGEAFYLLNDRMKLTLPVGQTRIVGPFLEDTLLKIATYEPEAFRAHVLSDEFFGAERHPEVVFKSSKIDLADDGAATVEGTLAIKGIEKPVVARGSWQALDADAFGRKRSHLELEAVVNRHDYKMDWNAPLPNGGQALADDVTITVDLSLVAAEA